jgi:hypothetical protein
MESFRLLDVWQNPCMIEERLVGTVEAEERFKPAFRIGRIQFDSVPPGAFGAK